MLTKTKHHMKFICCIILLLINILFTTGPPVGLAQVDDDPTGPLISVAYTGAYTTAAPGMWEIAIEDLESGLAAVQIFVNGLPEVQEALTGEPARAYAVPVPDTAGLHALEVRAQNNDEDYAGDQEGCVYIEIVEIGAYEDDDVDPPEITLTHADMIITDGDAMGGILVEWTITDASGLAQATVWVNGTEIAAYGPMDSIAGSYVLPNDPGVYTIAITARDNDNDPEHPVGEDWLESSAHTTITIVDDDTTPPWISLPYDGDGTTDNPGVWNIIVDDHLGSGLAEVKISMDGLVLIHEQHLGGIVSKSYVVGVPAMTGVHTIEVVATDNDNDWDGDQLERTITDSIEITPPPIIIGLALAIGPPPRIKGVFSPPPELSGKTSGRAALTLQAPSDQRTIFPDGDGDCVCDVADNCPLIPNPNQWDSDGDGIGDVCEEPMGAPLLTDAVVVWPVALLTGALLLLRRRQNRR